MVRMFADQTAICQFGQVMSALRQFLDCRHTITMHYFINLSGGGDI
tara:strand:+ start:366 stop:503 length:138 start_codon:yes stop_codon:yes gene_type:complete